MIFFKKNKLALFFVQKKEVVLNQELKTQLKSFKERRKERTKDGMGKKRERERKQEKGNSIAVYVTKRPHLHLT